MYCGCTSCFGEPAGHPYIYTLLEQLLIRDSREFALDNEILFDRHEELLTLLFASLVDILSEYDWKRERIWKSKIASFEVQHSPGCRLSFDVFIDRENHVRLQVVARNAGHGVSLAQVLADLEGDVRPAVGKGARFEVPLELMLFDRDGVEGAAGSVATAIREVRGLLGQWSGPPERWIASNGVPVDYVDRPGRNQSDRLVVVFSSIRAKRYWLDFGGPHGSALKGVRANILFVLDDIGEEFNYNLRVRGSREVEEATVEFLNDYISARGLRRENVVLCGMSKGATAAICLGSRMGGVRVLASVPQMRLGSYLAQRGDGILDHMFDGGGKVDSVSIADSMVPARLRVLLESGRDVVVMTSSADSNCFDVLVGESSAWEKYGNLDLILFENSTIRDHVSTLRYATPAFLGWLTLFSVGMTPTGLGAALQDG